MIILKHSLLLIHLHEQQAYIFVQCSHIAKNWNFCTLIIINISVAPPLDPKTLNIRKTISKHRLEGM